MKNLFLVILVLFSCYSFADSNNSAQELIPLLNNTKTLQANFVQIIYDKSGNVLQQTQGQMSLQRPGKFRWETHQPTKQILVADGKNIWFYDVELAQVAQQKQQPQNQNSPAMLLSGNAEQLIKDYSVTAKHDTDSTSFKLIPKSKNSLFQAVELFFKQENLQKMQLTDNLNQTTTVDFSNVRSNEDLNPNLFRFTVPKNVDVVRQ